MWEVLTQILIGFVILTAISGVVLFGVWVKAKFDGPYGKVGNEWMAEQRRRDEAGEDFLFEDRLEFWKTKIDPDWEEKEFDAGVEWHHDHIQMHKDMGDYEGMSFDGAWSEITTEINQEEE